MTESSFRLGSNELAHCNSTAPAFREARFLKWSPLESGLRIGVKRGIRLISPEKEAREFQSNSRLP